MKLDATIIDKDAHLEFRRFLKNTGQGTWEKKIAKTHSLPRLPSPSPNSYRNYLAAQNPLTSAIAAFLEIDGQGKLLRKHLSKDLMKVTGYLKIMNACYSQVDKAARKKIEAILTDDETVRSFLFELDIATHFFRRDQDVKFIDLENLETFDLLVSDGIHEVEIECKTKSADAGRKITRGNFALLCDVLASDLYPLQENIAIHLQCDDRLSGNQELFYNTAAAIKECIANRRSRGGSDGLSFEIRALPNNVNVRTRAEGEALRQHLWPDDPPRHCFVLSGPKTLLVACESTKIDRVLKSINEDLKKGASQLSKTRPSILACQIEDIYDEDWGHLQGESGLARMSNGLFESPNRNHVNFVIYSSDKTPPKTDRGVTSFSNTTLTFRNHNANHPFPPGFIGQQLGGA